MLHLKASPAFVFEEVNRSLIVVVLADGHGKRPRSAFATFWEILWIACLQSRGLTRKEALDSRSTEVNETLHAPPKEGSVQHPRGRPFDFF
ncbi:hypothetical protein [Caulifigura coniformis]|uniref:hypothetical protein n=1 Tax=Caulifigura coniformis TaxID=2527983 RepID=UPI0011A475A5|nr:hypothetical protein [Caulifigura coniformis]